MMAGGVSHVPGGIGVEDGDTRHRCGHKRIAQGGAAQSGRSKTAMGREVELTFHVHQITAKFGVVGNEEHEGIRQRCGRRDP